MFNPQEDRKKVTENKKQREQIENKKQDGRRKP